MLLVFVKVQRAVVGRSRTFKDVQRYSDSRDIHFVAQGVSYISNGSSSHWIFCSPGMFGGGGLGCSGVEKYGE